MAKFVIIILLLFIPITSFAGDDWTKEDTMREVVWGIIHVIDWGQTLEIARQPNRYYEMNPILGKHPSVGNVNLYMATSLIVHPMISYFLPKKYRKAWQYISIGISGGCVINNFNAHLKVKF